MVPIFAEVSCTCRDQLAIQETSLQQFLQKIYVVMTYLPTPRSEDQYVPREEQWRLAIDRGAVSHITLTENSRIGLRQVLRTPDGSIPF
jgi:hypothetical protein